MCAPLSQVASGDLGEVSSRCGRQGHPPLPMHLLGGRDDDGHALLDSPDIKTAIQLLSLPLEWGTPISVELQRG